MPATHKVFCPTCTVYDWHDPEPSRAGIGRCLVCHTLIDLAIGEKAEEAKPERRGIASGSSPKQQKSRFRLERKL